MVVDEFLCVRIEFSVARMVVSGSARFGRPGQGWAAGREAAKCPPPVGDFAVAHGEKVPDDARTRQDQVAMVRRLGRLGMN